MGPRSLVDPDVGELLEQKSFEAAIALLMERITNRPHDDRLRLQLAAAFYQASLVEECATVLLDLADEYARHGRAGKAIAVLKQVERIDPGHEGVAEKLAPLIREARPQAEAPTRPVAPVAGAATEGDAAHVASSPLFESFSHDELVAVIRGLRLLVFEPGDVLVTEGEPGDSLFVLTHGRVKAFVKDPVGHNRKVRELEEGAFFGEISILTGKPRTATVTAAAPCELLELDRDTLEAICAGHPRVREVLQQFYHVRANSTLEAAIRRGEAPVA